MEHIHNGNTIWVIWLKLLTAVILNQLCYSDFRWTQYFIKWYNSTSVWANNRLLTVSASPVTRRFINKICISKTIGQIHSWSVNPVMLMKFYEGWILPWEYVSSEQWDTF